ncbi:2OG-Fe(II) oxygenase [Pseudoxanthomonas gei]|uniref:2OG-Fe(II) oxygenase n=1 Tax=Pseudoxanthomonas gei TaxID=1383030 RepID=A0ABX0ABG2_9GAMM|nr:2OG-Fe(II) oxygenase family protein [Pseudoxanthomonas gei]NDK38914.1 2OG-Fe(II) oxygenase [Pseudoxanthomonas gei]
MISNDLQLAPHRDRLLARGRVQIPGFLQEASAQRLRHCLQNEVRWETSLRSDRPSPLGDADLVTLDEVQRRQLQQSMYRNARDEFAFVFDRYRMIDARRDGLDPGLVLHVVVDFLNSPAFLEFARELTGDKAIRMVSAIAARYRQGDFLNRHNDKAGDEDRAFAYVINLSREWQADWGGLLEFLADGQEVVETFTPRWNSLSLFRVPQAHQVSLVSPWAREDRYSITGWFRRS